MGSQIDVYPTIAELAGTVPTDHLDGVSLVPAFDDPTILTITSPAAADTLNKSVAYNQYPGQDFGGCGPLGYVVGGVCQNVPGGVAKQSYMGYSLRNHEVGVLGQCC